MEKQMTKKLKKDRVSISKIYETIKDKGFIQDLWLDVMSDMKEKPSYKRLKAMVEKVIESSVENYATKPKDPEERLKTRTIFTDLSIMTYTIDTLISELLYKKMKDEFESVLCTIVEDVKNKKKSLNSEDQQSKSFEQFIEFREVLCNGKKEHNENKVSDDDDDDGNSSYRSVSSVHTSDLSSFEDDISISSEDEDGIKTKKHVPLKLANSLYLKGKLSDLLKVAGKSSYKKAPSKMSSPINSTVESPNQRLSARMRKPNSKYVSDDMVCRMKPILSQSEAYGSEKGVLETESQKMEKVVTGDNKVRRGRPPKVIHSINDAIVKNSTSAALSNKYLPSSHKADLFHQGGKQVKRGRPPKNINLLKDKLVTDEDDSDMELKKKQGRPPKIVSVTSLSEQAHLNTESFDADGKSRQKQQMQDELHGSRLKNDSMYYEPESKRKKGRPPNDNIVKKIINEPITHSVESFSLLEESLCLKDKKTDSSSKNSSKSYSASDLYKPRSDFRVSFNSSRGSKALTLFSN